MAYVVVWMDTDEAKLFSFQPGQVKKDHVKISAQEAKQAHDRDHHKDPIHFYQDVVTKVKTATEILLVGPGMAKTHFSHYIEKHNGDVKKKIVGVQNMDHPTDNQIVAEARKFFKAHDLFESI